jgi:hypothetical protein
LRPIAPCASLLHSLLVGFFTGILLVQSFSFSAEGATAKQRQKQFEKEEQEIPKQPSPPPAFERPKVQYLYACERLYTYQGKALSCDSPSYADGEKLRPLLQTVPAAQAELDLYQWNKRTLNRTAYISTLGLVVALVGYTVNRPAFENNSIKPGGYLILSGLGLSAGSFAYGLTMNRNNESHLRKAVELYNSAKPDQPIELQFSTEFNLK